MLNENKILNDLKKLGKTVIYKEVEFILDFEEYKYGWEYDSDVAVAIVLSEN